MGHPDAPLNPKLLQAIPAGARRVLEPGCAGGALGRRFKEQHPATQWWGVDSSAAAVAAATPYLDRVIQLDLERADLSALEGGFDVIVIGDLLQHLREPQRLLESLYDLAAADAQIVCCLPNASHLSVIERLVAGDISVDPSGLLDASHVRPYSPSSAFKTFLDAGWLPNLADQYRTELPPTPFAARIVEAAQALGLPAETALRNLGLYQMVIVCRKWPMQALARGARPVPFSVIVPVNKPWQYELNVGRSPGLAEVGADIVCVRGAESAAAAYAEGAKNARHAWHLFVHQDVYFPVGSGFAIAQQLGALDTTEVPVGFAGIANEAGAERFAGTVIDRTALFRHGASHHAVSIDEFAVGLHRSSPLRIDATLGWHLWGTDLCLQAQQRTGAPAGRILDVPLFHNSTTAHSVPPAFNDSARLLLAKHPGVTRVPTLCGLLSRDRSAATA